MLIFNLTQTNRVDYDVKTPFYIYKTDIISISSLVQHKHRINSVSSKTMFNSHIINNYEERFLRIK